MVEHDETSAQDDKELVVDFVKQKCMVEII